MASALLRGGERLAEVVDQVLRVLQPDRQADRSSPMPALASPRRSSAEVRGAGRVDHQRLGVADVGEVREDCAAPR